MILNARDSSINQNGAVAAPSDAPQDEAEQYRPSIEQLLASAREDVARLIQILRHLHCSAVLRGMNEGPISSGALRALIYGAEGQPIALLEAMTGDTECSDSLDKLLSALLESFASAIAERWFRLSYRQCWVIAAVMQGEPDKSILLAVDRTQVVVGADQRARQRLATGRRSIEMDCTLATFFQVNGANICEKRFGDAAMTLPGRADGDPWSVLITPPDLDANFDLGERAILHARPRLDSIACAGRPTPQDDYQSGLSRRALRRVEEYIEAHLDSSLDIEELAACVGISMSHFSRSFFRSVGLTPHSYVMRRRLARAQHLLVKTDLALAEVAITTGFADQSHFCRRFREFVGSPPRSYRMQHR